MQNIFYHLWAIYSLLSYAFPPTYFLFLKELVLLHLPPWQFMVFPLLLDLDFVVIAASAFKVFLYLCSLHKCPTSFVFWFRPSVLPLSSFLLTIPFSFVLPPLCEVSPVQLKTTISIALALLRIVAVLLVFYELVRLLDYSYLLFWACLSVLPSFTLSFILFFPQSAQASLWQHPLPFSFSL